MHLCCQSVLYTFPTFIGFRLLKIVSEIGAGRSGGSGYIVWQEVFDNGVKVRGHFHSIIIIKIFCKNWNYGLHFSFKELKYLFSCVWYKINRNLHTKYFLKCRKFFYRHFTIFFCHFPSKNSNVWKLAYKMCLTSLFELIKSP